MRVRVVSFGVMVSMGVRASVAMAMSSMPSRASGPVSAGAASSFTSSAATSSAGPLGLMRGLNTCIVQDGTITSLPGQHTQYRTGAAQG